MKFGVVALGLTLFFATALIERSSITFGQSTGAAATLESEKALVSEYCVKCHNDRTRSGGFSWSDIDLAHPGNNAEQAEKVLRKLRSGMMPPSGQARPSAANVRAFSSALAASIDEAAAAHPYSRAPELHRVNRREYHNSIRDLLDVDEDVSALLPPDARTGSFDNMSDALTINPALMQAYVRAADKIARLAVGDAQAPAVMTKYDVPKVVNQMRHVDGAPFGTRGGISVVHNFPADGDYNFKLELYYYYLGELIGGNLPENLQGQVLEVSIDGERVAAFTIDPLIEEHSGILETPPIHIKAGPRRLSAAFVSKADGPVEDEYRLVEQTIMDVSVGLHPGMTTPPHLHSLTVTGPLKVTGVSETPSRKKIFICAPAKPSEEEACAKDIITSLVDRAFRRPATTEDLESLLEMYKVGRADGQFEDGIRTALQAILAKPEFVFRFERVPDGVRPGQSYRVSDLELASRLSYFLWSTAPDDQLIEIASLGKLHDPVVLEKQVKRMLTDPRSETISTNFAAQWLRLTGLTDIHPEPTIFPDFTRNLAESMRRETEMLFESIVREDLNILDLITADYTYVDGILARHYGIPNISGSQFRRVKLSDPNRFGLLGKGAILTLTSLANRTSPVARGKYVMEVLIGSPPPPPPPVVPPLKETVNNEKVLTVRERMEEHRKNQPCAGCHKMMDPIGLTLENFDAIGRWRVNDGGTRIDASSDMYEGSKLNGPASLRQVLLNHSDAFISNFTENLLEYAVGRIIDYRDMPTVRSIARQASKADNRFSSFVLGIVESAPFQMRTLDPATERDRK
jgi:cytochrome c551/c552